MQSIKKEEGGEGSNAEDERPRDGTTRVVLWSARSTISSSVDNTRHICLLFRDPRPFHCSPTSHQDQQKGSTNNVRPRQ